MAQQSYTGMVEKHLPSGETVPQMPQKYICKEVDCKVNIMMKTNKQEKLPLDGEWTSLGKVSSLNSHN